jgi:hypothetical protein
VAALEDVETANRLMSEALSLRFDSLLPQTRQLLDELAAYVTRRAGEQRMDRQEVRFTQRELREALGWQDRALRLSWLVVVGSWLVEEAG